MYGSWQVGERPVELRKPRDRVRLGLLTGGAPGHEAVFYHGPTVELLTPNELAQHPRLTSLGPDVMSPTAAFEPGDAFDAHEAARRLRAEGERPVKQALIDQTVVAGVGNIFASEALFVARVDPLRRSDGITDAEFGALWPALREMMWRGTARWGRTKTTPEEMQADGKTRWVYQRKGKPCHVCRTPVELIRLPPHDRATYRCPTCQH
jgi:formamidopyrimidine-DNA glycosylase